MKKIKSLDEFHIELASEIGKPNTKETISEFYFEEATTAHLEKLKEKGCQFQVGQMDNDVLVRRSERIRTEWSFELCPVGREKLIAYQEAQ